MSHCFDDGRRQTTAATCLLQQSKLLKWDRTDGKFVHEEYKTFSEEWINIDPDFGRFICWITFSAGAELLAKGVCLIHEVDMRLPKETPVAPSSGDDLMKWARQFNPNTKFGGIVNTTDYQTLGKLNDVYLKRLLTKVDVKAHEGQLLRAAYTLLAGTIRNRDAHAYVKDVRDDHFHLVEELFVPCFNLMVSWLPEGAGTLSQWVDTPL
jgi:hypothetical protein